MYNTTKLGSTHMSSTLEWTGGVIVRGEKPVPHNHKRNKLEVSLMQQYERAKILLGIRCEAGKSGQLPSLTVAWPSMVHLLP